MSGKISIAPVAAEDVLNNIRELGTLLHACVHAGANINFVLPFSQEDAEAFWAGKVLPPLRGGTRIVWVARASGRIAGSVQLDYGTPPNQAHRADVTKLLVHPDFRRRGIARALMAELETRASALGRRLIVLDTRTGDSAEPLYVSLGYKIVGIIPDFCRDPLEDKFHPTTIMYKNLRPL
jgi:ribosomal protein S18 acetylase RimI-like enzyme